jgi:hypothetical protein
LKGIADSLGARRIEYRAWEYYWALHYLAPAVDGRAEGVNADG